MNHTLERPQPPVANGRKVRVRFYIDGYNVYYCIKAYHKKWGRNYRWLDYRKFLSQFLKDNHHLAGITFFTAYPEEWEEGMQKRHDAYINALRETGVEVVSGYFAKRPGGGFEEKQTDVNIALAMVLDAADDKYDRCWLMSADNDFAPVLSVVRDKFGKEAGLMIPPLVQQGRERRMPPMRITSLMAAASTMPRTGKPLLLRPKFASHFAGCSLPPKIKSARGDIIMPPEYGAF